MKVKNISGLTATKKADNDLFTFQVDESLEVPSDFILDSRFLLDEDLKKAVKKEVISAKKRVFDVDDLNQDGKVDFGEKIVAAVKRVVIKKKAR